MYVIAKPSWFKLIFKVRGSVLPRIWMRVVLTSAVAMVFTVLHQRFHYFSMSLTVTPFTLIGLALSIFLGFRNNASYDRFWEGRRLWGQLVNTSRSFTRQIVTLIRPTSDDPEERARVVETQRTLVHRHVAFVHLLRLSLRDQRDYRDVEPFLPRAEMAAVEKEPNRPNAVLHETGLQVAAAYNRGWIHANHLNVLEGSMTIFSDVQGACERIKNTPIPFSYTVLIHRIVAVYCFLLPFGLVDTVKWLTPLVVLFVSYAFFGLDAIGDEIEQPFGLDVNDLPLYAISKTIEENVRRRIGDTDLPHPVQPKHGVLH